MIKMKEATLLLTFIVTVTIVTGLIEEQPMPNLLCDCFCNNNVTHHRADLVHYKCIQKYLARTYDQRWHMNVSTSAINYIKSLEREMAQTLLKRRPKRQTPFLYHGYRKEIRTLTTAERQQFFRAVNALKSDTSVFPNAYEAIAAFHSGASLPAAHGGPAFCPWHRYYTYLFESALRRKDRRVTLCYWDSSKDSNMPDPINSNIWGPDFLGNANGAVVTGPFAGWRISGGAAPLTRNFASGVNLFPSWGLRNIYSKTRNSEIMEPTAPSDSNLETFHNTVHSMIGGTMLDSNISPHDPVFFLHHGFIDCVWERFRQGQVKKIGAAFEYDYPSTNDPLHSPYAPFGNLRELLNINGLLSIFGDIIYKYDEPLECPACANTGFFYCDQSNQCVPTRRPDTGTTQTVNGRKKREVMTTNYDQFEHESVLDVSYQNSFFLNGEADVNLWAFLPVRLMYIRPKGTSFNCRPVRKGKIDWQHDIYFADNSSYHKINTDQAMETDKTYDSGSGATKILVQSDGLSYSGKYIDYGIVDTRQIVSETITYIAVKNPKNGISIAYVSAYDLHGLVCQPRCLDRSSLTVYYKKCSGVIKVTTGDPKMYGEDIVEAVQYRYTLADDGTNPKNRYQEIFLNFVCDYTGENPWKGCE